MNSQELNKPKPTTIFLTKKTSSSYNPPKFMIKKSSPNNSYLNMNILKYQNLFFSKNNIKLISSVKHILKDHPNDIQFIKEKRKRDKNEENYKCLKWSEDEQNILLDGIIKYKTNWEEIQKILPSDHSIEEIRLFASDILERIKSNQYLISIGLSKYHNWNTTLTFLQKISPTKDIKDLLYLYLSKDNDLPKYTTNSISEYSTNKSYYLFSKERQKIGEIFENYNNEFEIENKNNDIGIEQYEGEEKKTSFSPIEEKYNGINQEKFDNSKESSINTGNNNINNNSNNIIIKNEDNYNKNGENEFINNSNINNNNLFNDSNRNVINSEMEDENDIKKNIENIDKPFKIFKEKKLKNNENSTEINIHKEVNNYLFEKNKDNMENFNDNKTYIKANDALNTISFIDDNNFSIGKIEDLYFNNNYDIKLNEDEEKNKNYFISPIKSDEIIENENRFDTFIDMKDHLNYGFKKSLEEQYQDLNGWWS